MTREHFISNLSYWNSHVILLWEALENTSGDVIELGVGGGSTERLHEYCKSKGRKLFSYESSLEYYQEFEKFRTDQHEITYVGNNWEPMIERHREQIGVLFSDEAPGEMRKYNISMFAQTAQIIVAHDTEKGSDHGYKFSLLRPLFKYSINHEFQGAGTTAFSNFVDVNKWNV